MVSCDVILPLGNSDHNGIGLLLNWSSKPPSVKAKQRSIWKYDHADFDKANRVISDADWSFVKDQIDVDVAWDLWELEFLSIMEECIPKGTVPTRQNLAWLNRNIRFKIRKRNSMYRKARSTKNSSHWRKYTTLRNEVVKLLRKSKREYLKKAAQQGAKGFWTSIKHLRKASSLIPTLKLGSVVASTNIEKASLINDVFSDNFNSAIPPLSPADLTASRLKPLHHYLITSFVLKKRS